MNTNGPLLPFVLTAGLLDSLNPCAIAILLIFLALMFTLRKSRSVIMIMGSVYIAAVFLTYFAIGLGIFKVIHLFNTPHFMARLGAWVVIAIGVWGLKEYFLPGKFRLLSISLGSRQLIAKYATRATVPAALVTGILVGLCEFPCSGAVYVATLGLLAAKATFIKGLGYLVLYNFMFVLPLIIIFAATTNRMMAEKLLTIDETNSSKLRLASALIMIAIGVVILVWFV